MKKCSIDECESDCFSSGFCRFHWGIYKAKPIKKGPYKLAKMSTKRQAQAKTYTQQIKVSNAIPNQLCFFCNKLILGTVSNHHLLKRDGERLIDESLYVPSHNNCHVFKFHSWSVHKLKLEPWWEGFLIRLKEKCPEAYDKIIAKFDK